MERLISSFLFLNGNFKFKAYDFSDEELDAIGIPEGGHLAKHFYRIKQHSSGIIGSQHIQKQPLAEELKIFPDYLRRYYAYQKLCSQEVSHINKLNTSQLVELSQSIENKKTMKGLIPLSWKNMLRASISKALPNRLKVFIKRFLAPV